MSNISQTGKHIFYTLNSLIASRNADGKPFDIEAIKEAFKDAIITDTFRKSLYAQELEFGYVGFAYDPNSKNSYSEITAYSTYAYDYLPYVDTDGSNSLLKITFNNGLFSLEKQPTCNLKGLTLEFASETGIIQNNGKEVYIECGTTPVIGRLVFESLTNSGIAAPYHIKMMMGNSSILDANFNDLSNYTDLTSSPGLLNFTSEQDRELVITITDKFGIVSTETITIKYRKRLEVYRTNTKTGKNWHEVYTALKSNVGSQNVLIDKIYKENNTVNLTNIEDQYILIKTPEASFNGNKFYATLSGGCVVEFIKVKDHYYVSTGTNWNGLTLTINI